MRRKVKALATLSVVVLFTSSSLPAIGQTLGSVDGSGITEKLEDKLFRRLLGLDNELARIGACRIGEINDIVEDLNKERKAVLAGWEHYYGEGMVVQERRLKNDVDDLATFAELVANRKTDAESARTDLTDVERRWRELPQNLPNNKDAQDARSALAHLRTSLIDVIESFADLEKTVAAQNQARIVKNQMYKDWLRLDETRLAKRRNLDATYQVMIRSAASRRVDACRPGLAPNQ